jgi:predicted DNA-binding transcriptional regulator AlpA
MPPAIPESSNPGLPRRRRFVRHSQLRSEFGIPWSKMHCDRLTREGKFARKIHLGPGTAGYWSDEIEAFLASRDAAAPPSPPTGLEKAQVAAKAARRARLNPTERQPVRQRKSAERSKPIQPL